MSTPSVLFVITRLGVGGAETQLVRIATELRARGWRVGVLSLGTPTAFEDILRSAGVAVLDLSLRPSRPSPRALQAARAFVAEVAPDVLCAFLFHATALAAVLAGLDGRLPVVASVRDPTLGGRTRLLTMAVLDRAGRIDATVANSQLVAQSFVRRGVVAAHRMHVIPNAIDTSDTAAPDPSVRAELGVSANDFLWLAVGNFLPQKDHATLLAAFELLQRKRPEARLRIAGGGEPPAAVDRQLRRLAPAVRALGSRGDVPRLMAACDAFVLSSKSEGFPNVIVEALREARPVVSTSVGGVPELVEHGVSGFLAPPRSPTALACEMERLMATSKAARARMGLEGQRRIRERHDSAFVVDRWEELLRAVSRRRRA